MLKTRRFNPVLLESPRHNGEVELGSGMIEKQQNVLYFCVFGVFKPKNRESSLSKRTPHG